jgi:hypothetical protein
LLLLAPHDLGEVILHVADKSFPLVRFLICSSIVTKRS